MASWSQVTVEQLPASEGTVRVLSQLFARFDPRQHDFYVHLDDDVLLAPGEVSRAIRPTSPVSRR